MALPFTLASYMIEGGGSRNYIHAKKMMYNSPADWDALMSKLVAVTTEYSAEQVRAGADVIQIFDSWVGCLSVEDYRRYVLPHVTGMVKGLQKTGVPIIYFGTDSATLLPAMKETGADVIGLDWRIPLDEGWERLHHRPAVQGNLDPVLLFADWKELKSRAEDILRRAAGRPGHIFNLGHGILPGNSGRQREEPGAPRAGVFSGGRLRALRLPESDSDAETPDPCIHDSHCHHRRRHFRAGRPPSNLKNTAAPALIFDYVLYESSPRLGGVLRTEYIDGCIVEAGPDSFITEKPWASRSLLVPSAWATS